MEIVQTFSERYINARNINFLDNIFFLGLRYQDYKVQSNQISLFSNHELYWNVAKLRQIPASAGMSQDKVEGQVEQLSIWQKSQWIKEHVKRRQVQTNYVRTWYELSLKVTWVRTKWDKPSRGPPIPAYTNKFDSKLSTMVYIWPG